MHKERGEERKAGALRFCMGDLWVSVDDDRCDCGDPERKEDRARFSKFPHQINPWCLISAQPRSPFFPAFLGTLTPLLPFLIQRQFARLQVLLSCASGG